MAAIKRSQITGMNFHYLHYPLTYFLDSMVRYQFEHIELWGAAPHCYVEDLSSGDLKQIRRELDVRGLTVVCFTPEQCMYPVNLAAKENAVRERSLQYFQKSIEASAELQSPIVLVTAGWGYRNEPREEAWQRSCDSLRQLAEYAQQMGITLALEPAPTHRIQSGLRSVRLDAHAWGNWVCFCQRHGRYGSDGRGGRGFGELFRAVWRRSGPYPSGRRKARRPFGLGRWTPSARGLHGSAGEKQLHRCIVAGIHIIAVPAGSGQGSGSVSEAARAVLVVGKASD